MKFCKSSFLKDAIKQKAKRKLHKKTTNENAIPLKFFGESDKSEKNNEMKAYATKIIKNKGKFFAHLGLIFLEEVVKLTK